MKDSLFLQPVYMLHKALDNVEESHVHSIPKIMIKQGTEFIFEDIVK